MKPSIIMLCALLGTASLLRAQENGAWSITIPDSSEAGEAMVITGTVLGGDPQAPLAGVRVHVYHTDIQGYYSEGSRSDGARRLQGTMWTDEQGRYRYRTIRPGPYPQGGIPAHVHYEIETPHGFRQRFELLFEGGRFISERTRQRAVKKGDFFYICQLEADESGVLHGTYDLYLDDKPESE